MSSWPSCWKDRKRGTPEMPARLLLVHRARECAHPVSSEQSFLIDVLLEHVVSCWSARERPPRSVCSRPLKGTSGATPRGALVRTSTPAGGARKREVTHPKSPRRRRAIEATPPHTHLPDLSGRGFPSQKGRRSE